jgi:hypothetical protein
LVGLVLGVSVTKASQIEGNSAVELSRAAGNLKSTLIDVVSEVEYEVQVSIFGYTFVDAEVPLPPICAAKNRKVHSRWEAALSWSGLRLT